MIHKINKYLYSVVSAFDQNENDINLIIYCRDLDRAIAELSQIQDVILTKKFSFIKAVGVKAKPTLLHRIANINAVKHITYASTVSTLAQRSRNVLKISEFYKSGYLGKDINIAVIDTGCCEHFDLFFPESKVIYFKDFVGEKEKPYDDNGHGTFVAGLIAGNGLLSGSKYFGVAPQSKIIALKALDEKGETSAFHILEAMQWVLENKQKYNIKIVCMSFGSIPLGVGDPLVNGAEQLWRNGIVVVAAAGNSGPEKQTIKSPGVSSRIITVGAFDVVDENEKNFKVADFSSRGPTNLGMIKPDCIAPGVDIVGLSCDTNFYKKMSGTSTSAPIIAGVSALMLEKWPKLTPNQIKMELMRSGHKIVFDRNIEGSGWVDCSKIN